MTEHNPNTSVTCRMLDLRQMRGLVYYGMINEVDAAVGPG